MVCGGDGLRWGWGEVGMGRGYGGWGEDMGWGGVGSDGVGWVEGRMG